MFDEGACVCVTCKLDDSTSASSGEGKDLVLTCAPLAWLALATATSNTTLFIVSAEGGHLLANKDPWPLNKANMFKVEIMEVEVSFTLMNSTTLDVCPYSKDNHSDHKPRHTSN